MGSKVEELVELAGFTEYEKNVYCALFDLGKANVRELAERSSVPKPKVYSVLDTLYDRGFVVLEDEDPKTYSVFSPKAAFEEVAKQKKQELNELNDLVESVENDRPEKSSEKFLRIVRGRDNVLEFLAEQLEEVESEYVTVGRFVSSYTPLQPVMDEKENVDMKFIGPKKGSRDFVVEKYRKMGLEVRTVEMEEIPFRFSIYDNERLALTLSEEDDGYTTVWTNYPSLVKNMREFFDFYWNNSE